MKLIVENDENKVRFADFVPMKATNIFHHDRIIVEGQHEGKAAMYEGGTVQDGNPFLCDLALAQELERNGLAVSRGGDLSDRDPGMPTPHYQIPASDIPGHPNSTAIALQRATQPAASPEGFAPAPNSGN
jgi:hypothetical protein